MKLNSVYERFDCRDITICERGNDQRNSMLMKSKELPLKD